MYRLALAIIMFIGNVQSYGSNDPAAEFYIYNHYQEKSYKSKALFFPVPNDQSRVSKLYSNWNNSIPGVSCSYIMKARVLSYLNKKNNQWPLKSIKADVYVCLFGYGIDTADLNLTYPHNVRMYEWQDNLFSGNFTWTTRDTHQYISENAITGDLKGSMCHFTFRGMKIATFYYVHYPNLVNQSICYPLSGNVKIKKPLTPCLDEVDCPGLPGLPGLPTF